MSWFSEKWKDYVETPIKKISETLIKQPERLVSQIEKLLKPPEIEEATDMAATTNGATGTAADISDVFTAQQQMIGSLSKLLETRDQPASTVYVQPAAAPATAAPNYLLYLGIGLVAWLIFRRKGKLL